MDEFLEWIQGIASGGAVGKLLGEAWRRLEQSNGCSEEDKWQFTALMLLAVIERDRRRADGDMVDVRTMLGQLDHAELLPHKMKGFALGKES